MRVAISKLRANLMFYLKKAEEGEEIIVTTRGHIIARIAPPAKNQEEARERLKKLRSRCQIHDITSPIATEWESNK